MKCTTHVVIAEEVPIFNIFHQYVRWVGTCLFWIFEPFEMLVTVTPELFKRCEHLILNKSSKGLIVEIKHEKALRTKKNHIY